MKIPSKNIRENQQIHELFIQFVCMVAPTFFGITLPSSGSVPSASRDAQLRSSRQNIVDGCVVSIFLVVWVNG
jgi:hypothetical protein